MKSTLLLVTAVTLSFTVFAQRIVKMRTMWDRPQVHVHFEGYTVSFRVQDINKALGMLYETGVKKYGTNCMLDTAGTYPLQLNRDLRLQYRSGIEPIMHKAIGAYLITAGRAYIQNRRGKRIAELEMDIQPLILETNEVFIMFYDKKTKKLVFAGSMPADMYNKDMGLD